MCFYGSSVAVVGFGLAVAWSVVFREVCNHCGCGCEGGMLWYHG